AMSLRTPSMTGAVRGCCVEGRRRAAHRADSARGWFTPRVSLDESQSESRMPEIGTFGLMSGDGKRGVAEWPKLPRPPSTLPKRTCSPRRRKSAYRAEPNVAKRCGDVAVRPQGGIGNGFDLMASSGSGYEADREILSAV